VTRSCLPLPTLLLTAAAAASLACACSSSPAPATATARSCALAAPATTDWRLHTDGVLLRDSLGRVVFLRGVNAGGRSKLAPFVPFDYASGQFANALGAYMDRAASWGIDAMRVPFTWQALESTQGQRDTNWLSQYQQILDAAWARGIWTWVDFHQDLYSESYCGDGFPLWTVPNAPAPTFNCAMWQFEWFSDVPMQKAFDAFWAAGSPIMADYVATWDFLVARFKDEPGVVGFEPINEPGWGTAPDPGTFEATTLSAFFAQIVPHMRQAAPDSLVLVEPTGIAGDNVTTGLLRPPGDGFVFAPHYYPVKESPDDVPLALPGWAAVGAAWNVPTILGEFGIGVGLSNDVAYVESCFNTLDTLGMSGTAWEYSESAQKWNDENFSFVAADGTENDTAKALIRPFARAVAGSAIAQSWDPSSSTFALSYVPASGVTEVQLPSRAYPSGYDVSLSGGCYDKTSTPGRLLVQADPEAKTVALRVTATSPAAP
jgi:endoglycosylceramidase